MVSVTKRGLILNKREQEIETYENGMPRYDEARYHIELLKLMDHIANNAPNEWTVYHNMPESDLDWNNPSKGDKTKAFHGDYQAALAYYTKLNEKGVISLALATRIGTACVFLMKEIK